jgi:hypothetical protein
MPVSIVSITRSGVSCPMRLRATPCPAVIAPSVPDRAARLNLVCSDNALEFNLNGKKLKMDPLWINILPEGGIHASHLHPHSVISGTTYVAMPLGTSAIKFEDPRLAMMMAGLCQVVIRMLAGDEFLRMFCAFGMSLLSALISALFLSKLCSNHRLTNLF